MALELETLAVALVANVDKFQKDLGAADKIAQGWGTKIGGSLGKLAIGGAVAGGAAVAGAIAVVGKAALDVSTQVGTAAASMADSLGIPKAEAMEFASVARTVYGNNLSESVLDAAEAVKVVAQQFKLAADDPSLQRITENAIKVRDTFDIEVGESVSAVKTLMDNFGISADEAFNLLVAGQQRGLNRSGDLVDTIEEYSTQFANGGASATMFFNLLESGLAGGMLGTDKAADAFKEFRVRIQDGSDTTAAALEAIGINSEFMLGKLASGETTAAEVFDLVTQKLGEQSDSTVQMQAGVALLGTQFEDLGNSAATGLDLYSGAFANVEGAADSLNNKYDTFGAATEALWRRLVVSVSPFTDKLLGLVNDAMPKVMAAFDAFDQSVGPIMEGVGTTIDNVVNFVKGLFDQFKTATDTNALGPLEYWKQWADTNLPMLQTLFNNVLGGIQRLWEIFGPAIELITSTVFNNIWSVIDTAMRNIGDVITLALQLLTGDFEGARATLEGIVTRTWDMIYGIFSNTLGTIQQLVSSIDWWGLGSAIIEGIANGISNGAQHIVNAAQDAAQNALNAAKSWLGISSPSKVAANDIGEPFAEGVGVGAMRGLRSLAGQLDTGLARVMGDLSMPEPVMAGAGGGRSPINIYLTLQGSATYEDGRAVGAGISDELRARGLA